VQSAKRKAQKGLYIIAKIKSSANKIFLLL
jgi:hypothetical protein